MPLEGGPRPLFSVIIPTYNRKEKLLRALESLECQTFRDFEVLVCDDGSTDGTQEMVANFADRMPLRYFWEENFGGPARPRNIGIREARGAWICFLDADDWWYPAKLQTVAQQLDSADFICHDCHIVTPSGRRRFTRKSRKPRSPLFVDFMTRGCRIITSSVSVRREIIDKAGFFTEEREFIAIEDTDLWIRISRITERFLYLPERLGAYWEDGSNISGFSEHFISRITALHDKFAGELDPEQRAEAEFLLTYRTAVVRRALGQKSASRKLFMKVVASRNFRMRLYALLNLLMIGFDP
jgi:glycosyltransferase involved in cell wall biosynthesis